jgi:CRP-like cAMP-binding protein
MPDGPPLEVATTGREGVVGLPVFFGAPASSFACVAQIPGLALRLSAAAFRQEVPAGHPLQALLHRYTQTLLLQIAQSLACNQRHGLEERCCRWLLMTHDRVGADTFVLTQELLGRMLGVRRQRASGVAGALQRAGLIHYRRGVITIVERAGLEARSCACYRIITDEYERVLGRLTEGS